MRDDVFYLKTIISYCADIGECINTFGNDEEEFLSNKVFQKSCAFDILQIGEAAKSLSFDLTDGHHDV